MNRIQNLVDYELGSALISTMPVAAPAPAPQGEAEGAHCIFTPLHYERNYAYPLIVWLHGADDDERQVTRIMPHVSLRNYVAVGARGTLASGGVEGGYRWSQGQRHIVQAEQRVMSAVAAARRWLNIAPARIFLAGLHSGGTMAFRLALNHPQTFAGVLSIGGAFPTTLRPLGQLRAVRRQRIFLATGKDSLLYSETQVCNDVRLFHSAGMAVHVFQYPSGDEVLTNMLSDMDRWIMAQVASPAPVEHDQVNPRHGGK